jgi:hypothetical protein
METVKKISFGTPSLVNYWKYFGFWGNVDTFTTASFGLRVAVFEKL